MQVYSGTLGDLQTLQGQIQTIYASTAQDDFGHELSGTQVLPKTQGVNNSASQNAVRYSEIYTDDNGVNFFKTVDNSPARLPKIFRTRVDAEADFSSVVIIDDFVPAPPVIINP